MLIHVIIRKWRQKSSHSVVVLNACGMQTHNLTKDRITMRSR